MVLMPVWKVVLFGGLSAAAWNALILAVAWSVGGNFERLQDLFHRYTTTALVVVVLAGLLLAARLVWWRRRAAPPPGDGS
jgi:membrane-associated protein